MWVSWAENVGADKVNKANRNSSQLRNITSNAHFSRLLLQVQPWSKTSEVSFLSLWSLVFFFLGERFWENGCKFQLPFFQLHLREYLPTITPMTWLKLSPLNNIFLTAGFRLWLQKPVSTLIPLNVSLHTFCVPWLAFPHSAKSLLFPVSCSLFCFQKFYSSGCVVLNVRAYIFKCYLNVDESQICNFTVNPTVSCSLIPLSFSFIVLELLAWCVAIKDECVAGEMAWQRRVFIALAEKSGSQHLH